MGNSNTAGKVSVSTTWNLTPNPSRHGRCNHPAVSRARDETSLYRGSIFSLPRRCYRILHKNHCADTEYPVTTLVTNIVGQGYVLIPTTTADCVRIIYQGKTTLPRRLRSAKVLPTHCHRQPLPMDLQDESETAKPSQSSDLSKETLCYHWTGTMIYTLALQSFSLPAHTIARLFMRRRIQSSQVPYVP